MDRLERTSQENRERVQTDFDIAMTNRRDRAIAMITELEEQSQTEARSRLTTANERAKQTIDTTNRLAEQAIEESNTSAANQVADARRITEQMMEARTSILRQLDAVRAQLEKVPAALAAPDAEAATVAQRITPASFSPVTAPVAQQLADGDATAAQTAPKVLHSDKFPVARPKALEAPTRSLPAQSAPAAIEAPSSRK